MSTKYISSNWRLLNKAGVDSYKSDNYGLTFNGSNESISLNTSTLSFADSFSISMWINPSSLSGFQMLFGGSGYSGGNGIGHYIHNNTVRTYVSVGGTATEIFQSSALLNINTWTHIVIQREKGTKWEMWVDGVLEETNTSARLTDDLTSTNSTIAKHYNSGLYNFDGSISECAVFDYALSSTQISTLYGSSSLGAGNPMALKPQPVAYYPLGDNSASNPLTQPNEAVEDASVFDFLAAPTYSRISLGTTSFTGNKTISFWLNKGSNNGTVLGFGNTNYYPNVQSTTLQLNNGSTTILSTGTINLNEWNHYVITGDGTTAKCYVNGVYKSTGTDRDISSGATWIGGQNNGTGMLLGKLSNVQQWETVLTDGGVSIGQTAGGEIAELYNSGVPLTGTQPQASNLKAWYKLDQSANWEADSSGNWQIPDAVSAYPQSFDFDGSDDVININNDSAFNLGTSFTISGWFNFSSNKYQGLISFDNSSPRGWFLFQFSDNSIKLFDGTTSFTLKSSYTTTDQWDNFVVTYDGTDLVFYINGIQQTTQAVSINLQTNGNDGQIGNNQFTTGRFLNGKTSNIQLFNTALPATGTDSVETLYNNGVPLTTAIASDNLKAWYKLDNTATFSTNWSIPDASGNGNTGTSSGMTEQNLVNNNVSALNGESSGMTSANLVLSDLTRAVPYGDGYSFYLDGTGDYVDVASSTIGTGYTEFSVSAWAKFDGSSNYECIASVDGLGGRVWQLFQWSSNRGLAFQLFNNSGTGAVTPINSFINASNTWYHCVGTYDGSNIRLYVNGNLEATVAQTGTVRASTTENFKIGSNGYNEDLEGYVNNVSIYDKALTSTEIMKLYANGVPQDLTNFNPQPVAFYPLGSNSFWNGSAWTVRDMIGSNDGTGVNLGQDALVGDSPRSSANGTGTNMDIESNIALSTKWSDNNSISINMSSEARKEDTP